MLRGGRGTALGSLGTLIWLRTEGHTKKQELMRDEKKVNAQYYISSEHFDADGRALGLPEYW